MNDAWRGTTDAQQGRIDYHGGAMYQFSHAQETQRLAGEQAGTTSAPYVRFVVPKWLKPVVRSMAIAGGVAGAWYAWNHPLFHGMARGWSAALGLVAGSIGAPVLTVALYRLVVFVLKLVLVALVIGAAVLVIVMLVRFFGHR